MWHLMDLHEDVRTTEELYDDAPPRMAIVGTVALSSEAYATWRKDRHMSSVTGRALRDDVWGDPESFPSTFLDDRHQQKAALPTQAELDGDPPDEWLQEALAHFDDLGEAGAAWFTEHLVNDAGTKVIYAGVSCLHEHQPTLDVALLASLVLRSKVVTGREAPVDDDVAAVVAAYRTKAKTMALEVDLQMACAALRCVTAWMEGREPPQWALELLWEELGEGALADAKWLLQETEREG